MRVAFTDRGWEDYLSWQANESVIGRLNDLIEECRRTPFHGRGKPEPLRRELSGFWSRRLSEEHRLVYAVAGKGADQSLEIVQCRGHY